ncbi:MAG: RNA polymerase sigma factor, partial [Nitrospirae bacterium]|nr:RNA polymerase sigma factor [Fimbriimonadaceae bacterium]
GLALVESLGLDARLQGYFPWAITRAELMRRLEHPETAGAFGEALALATNPADRKFVEAKMESLGPSLPDPL